MRYDLYQIDAFTNKSFGGNPACIVPLENWLSDSTLLKIAKENAVSETAFFVIKEHNIHLRWFTPEIEMDLCGHATIATAHALKTILGYPSDEIIFETLSGKLVVTVCNAMYKLDFPSRMPMPDVLPNVIERALNILPKEVLKSRDYFLVFENEAEIRNIKINRSVFDEINLDPGGVIMTAKGDIADFVSRFFIPQSSIFEDPVTGSAHCSLISFWSKQLNKKELHAFQISERIGELFCEDNGDRVIISGEAKTYSIGHFWLD